MFEEGHSAVEWLQFPDAASVCSTALQRLVVAAHAAQEQRGMFHIALAGGSTPRQLYQAWRQLEDFNWQQTEVYWGDERAVPADDAHSNYKMAVEALLQHVPIPAAQVHRMPADSTDLDAAAWQYEELLHQRLGPQGRLDLLLLGLGTDAHTASLFPGAASLQETERWVVSSPAPVIAPRLTGTAAWFNAAREVLFLVAGATKQRAVERVRDASESPRQVPARLIAPHDGRVSWLLDRQAAGDPASLP